MIIERDGKFYRKVEREEEISEIEALREMVKELQEKINSLPAISINPAPVVICPCPCPKREEPVNPWPYQPYQPIYITSDINTFPFDETVSCHY